MVPTRQPGAGISQYTSYKVRVASALRSRNVHFDNQDSGTIQAMGLRPIGKPSVLVGEISRRGDALVGPCEEDSNGPENYG